ncbi:hypothetical protein LMJF_24_1040 [Leishmania major strain Friedlin]|uniref:Uncharacterized protein n=1 Tax=Leishmania major TaxID=5664 RepID=Q4QAM9_LEIMA|nr:hypothetical protein LMJF_24_1040 [Leishmania major strain Friedlin]CAG9574571.1 hypothetical_protein_-_conserved [Leishmania major strain Friedlin]CAJ04694.1 hypothetical protein LMJF_24_1040 [Leishmania major strain Friedlin]|eukprot:XP_001683619.1 hypothetical protein LMJF_24_1040 [Leishmania major strain Friedlin]
MMAAVHPSADLSCDVAIHLSDTEFTSRIDYADTYVLPTTSTTAAASADAAQLPTATLVSPWLLVSPSVCSAYPSSSPSVAVTAAGAARSPAVETVPLAWRCPSCGTLEVEQLYWRRPQRSEPAATDEASTAVAVRAALARSTRLTAPSPALQAKLERHRWRRERREEMRWRPLHISARCRSCFLCPRCGGHGSLPFSEAAQVIDTSTAKSTAASSSLFPTPANVLRSTQSVSSLDIRLTSNVQYYAVCMCCQWHSYRAFPTMEQLLGYLDAVMGDEKAETLRERRAAQRSLNTALRAGLTGLLGVYSDLENHARSQHQQQQVTVSQAAWDKFRHLRSAHICDRSAGPPSHSSSQQQKINGKMTQDAIMHLHPALALEQLRHQEQQRQEAARAASLLQGVSQAAPQAMRVVDLAREAAAKLPGAQEGEAKDRTPLSEWPPAHRSTSSASITASSAKNDVEVNLIARTQHWLLGLPLEAVDTRRQSIQTWMQRYQPAAVVAQERKTAAAAAAAMTSTSALMHTPTSAYLHSVLLREQDRPLGLPAYYITRVRKELLTALVWRLPPAFAARKPSAAEQSLPCTRFVLLDRHALSDAEVRQVCQHWVDERTAQVERHERKRRSELEQRNSACSTTTTAGKQRNDGDGGFDSDGGDEEDDDDEEGIECPKGGASQDSMHPATAQHPPPQQRIKKSVSSKLPLPLFLDGTDFSALSCLPFLEYVRSDRGSGGDGGDAHLCKWQFRLMNLHMMHDVYLTRLEVVRTVVAPSCAVAAPHARPSPFLLSASAACVTVQLSSLSAPAVELPVVLAPRCSPEERAAALAAVLQGRDGSRVGDAGPSPPLSIPSIVTMGITTPPTRLPELHVTLRDTSATQAGEPSSPMRTPLRCVELLVEVLTALSDVEHAHPQYHAVRYGLVVTLNSC